MALDILFQDITAFTEAGGLRLRAYQVRVARALVESVFQGRGLTFTILFPRQSGKNELQAQIEAYLLAMLAYRGAELVKISPTWKPQAQNAMARLERVLEANLLTRGRWHKQNGYIYCIGRARITFLSGAPEANIVGATASTLLARGREQGVRARGSVFREPGPGPGWLLSIGDRHGKRFCHPASRAYLAGAVKLEFVNGREGKIAKAVLTAISNTRRGSGEAREEESTASSGRCGASRPRTRPSTWARARTSTSSGASATTTTRRTTRPSMAWHSRPRRSTTSTAAP